MTDKTIRWFDAFLGLGYQFFDVRAKVIVIFNSRRTLLNAWNKVIKWWPDDIIKMRFLENDGLYEFMMYGDSRILDSLWVFQKTLNRSEHFETFRNDYDGATYLRLALYKPKKNSSELELFDYQKRVSDVLFLKEPLETEDVVLLEYISLIHNKRKEHEHHLQKSQHEHH